MRIARNLAAFAVGLCVAASTFAQGYPSKPVRAIVPFTAGSGVDIVARMVSQKLTEFWGQPVIVENHVGAGGTVGVGVVAKSPPDGYTLLINSTAHAVNVALYAKLPYDPLKDFVDVSALVAQPYVLVAGTSAGVKTVSELIAAAKVKPGQVSFGSAGIGSGTHMVAEKFRLAASVDVVHLPNKGGPEANTDAMTGRVTYWFAPIALVLPHVREGKLLALGVSSARRSSLLPGVPTIAEAGLGGFEDAIWYGMWAPAATPADVVNKLSKDVARALATPDVRDRLTKLGAEPMNMTPAEFTRFVRSEIEGAARVVKAAGIKPQ
jgi:tripartite-type tricarboxylate transporter receptor subunit TctC